MKKSISSQIPKFFKKVVVIGFLVFAVVLSGVVTVFAQAELTEQIQIISGTIFGSDDIKIYTMQSLIQGEKVYVFVEGTSATWTLSLRCCQVIN